MDTLPNSPVSGGFDNPNSSSVSTTIAPQAILNKALGQGQDQNQAPTPSAAPQQPVQQQPQAPQTPPQDQPHPAPVAPPPEKDPYAIFNPQPIEAAKQEDPYAIFNPQPIGGDNKNSGSITDLSAKMIKPIVEAVQKYFTDKDPNMSTEDKMADILKGGGTGLAQALLAIPEITSSIPTAVHNVGENLNSAMANEATGDNDNAPNTVEYPSLIHKLGMDYEPKSAIGNRAQLAGQMVPLPGAKAEEAANETGQTYNIKGPTGEAVTGDKTLFDTVPENMRGKEAPVRSPQGQTPPLKDTGLLPKSAGELTQNPDVQRFEEQAAAGVLGSEAQKHALDFRTEKSQAAQDELLRMGNAKEGANKADSMGAVADIVNKEKEASGKIVDAAYNHAREVNETSPVVIPPQDMEKGLASPLSAIEKKYQLNRGVSSSKQAENVLSDLRDKFVEPNEEEEILKPSNLEDLEAWRRNATRAANDSTDPTSSKAIKEMIGVYDKYTSNLIDKLPDSQGVQAYKNAVQARALHGSRFENNDMLDNIYNIGRKGSTKNIDNITNDFFGSGSIKGKGGLEDNYDALMRASGTQSNIVKQHLQDGFTQKIFDSSVEGRLPGSTNAAISPAKLKTQLENLFVSQRGLATKLYGQEAVDRANNLINELKLSEKQPKVTNPSGTSYMQKHIQDAATSILPSWAKFIVNSGKALGRAGAEGKAAQEAAQSFSGVTPDRFNKNKGILNSPSINNKSVNANPAVRAGLLNSINNNEGQNGPQ